MKIKSTFAILDVLGKHFAKRVTFGPCQEELRIPIVIYGYLDNQFGGDDGTSIEFTVCVERVDVI